MGGQNLSNLLALITLAWRYPVPKLADEHDNWKQGADTHSSRYSQVWFRYLCVVVHFAVCKLLAYPL